MNPATLSSKNVESARQEVRGPEELGPSIKRERILQRVKAARRRLAPNSSGPLARPR
jgi:hypothetical protein